MCANCKFLLNYPTDESKPRKEVYVLCEECYRENRIDILVVNTEKNHASGANSFAWFISTILNRADYGYIAGISAKHTIEQIFSCGWATSLRFLEALAFLHSEKAFSIQSLLKSAVDLVKFEDWASLLAALPPKAAIIYANLLK